MVKLLEKSKGFLSDLLKTSGVDTIAGDTTTTETVDVGSFSTGYINDFLDSDWFAVELEAGQSYVFETGSNGFDSVGDTILTLRDENGNELLVNDDYTSNNFYSQFTFTATQTATYYLDVEAFYFNDGVTEDGSTGAYTVSVDTTVPLDSVESGLVKTDNDNDGVFNVYFAEAGEEHTIAGVIEAVGETWLQYEVDAAMEAFGTYSDIIDVTFSITSDFLDADFVLVKDDDLAFGGQTVLGVFEFPSGSQTSTGAFNPNGDGWNSIGLNQGGYGIVTLIHEFGHGLGLAHPHDTGGGSNIMPGVFQAFGDYGDHFLNQGIVSIMSYNDGWQTAPHGLSNDTDYGWQGTPMALDIAALQNAYGANTTHNNGDNTYSLVANNASGTFYQTIWDTDGTDEIVASGSEDSIIDLRAATLEYEEGGGGFVSYTSGIHGGFTIANGVVIENATGAAGDDVIIGNEADNELIGLAGDDTLLGGAGDDILDGGAGDDLIIYDSADTTLALGGDGADTLIVIDEAAPLSFDLTAQSFEFAQVITNESGTALWDVRTETYDADWELTTKHHLNDDGSSNNQVFDVEETRVWSDYTDHFNTDGVRTKRETDYDNGSLNLAVYDVDDTKVWTNYVDFENAQGQRTARETNFDNGTRNRTQFDFDDSKVWSQFTDYFNESNQRTNRHTVSDDGSRNNTTYDADDSKSWNYFSDYFNTDGFRYARKTVDDDGSVRWDHYSEDDAVFKLSPDFGFNQTDDWLI